MSNSIHIAPNIPLYVSLVDVEGEYDHELNQGRYQTTDGRSLTLPRPAVIALNAAGPRNGEEVQIVQHWSGKHGEPRTWTVASSTRTELARAEAEMSQDLTGQLQSSVEAARERKRVPATPIAIPERKKPVPAESPRLFDRGTGTDGPAPLPAVALSIPIPAAPPKRVRTGQIPANVAVREILQFINADPSTANWGDQSKQDLASTVYIAHVKQGHIGLWERGE